MRPDVKERLEILKIEMTLLQSTFDKYDDLIFRNRNWFITLWAGAIGLAFTTDVREASILAAGVGLLYWCIEGTMRYQYWYKYVVRYRAVREWLNEPGSDSISVYDLTNHYGESVGNWERFRKSVFKLEPSLLALFLILSASVVFIFLGPGLG